MSRRDHDCRYHGHEFDLTSKRNDLVQVRECRHCPRRQMRVKTARRTKGGSLWW